MGSHAEDDYHSGCHCEGCNAKTNLLAQGTFVNKAWLYGKVYPVGALAIPDDGIERHTISEWNESGEYASVVYDPDGFNRQDIFLQMRLFTREEYEQGRVLSTLGPRRGGL